MMRLFTLLFFMMILPIFASFAQVQVVGDTTIVEGTLSTGADCGDAFERKLILKEQEQLALLNKTDKEIDEKKEEIKKKGSGLSKEEKKVYEAELKLVKTERKVFYRNWQQTKKELDQIDAEKNKALAEAQDNKEAAREWEKKARKYKEEGDEAWAFADSLRAKVEYFREQLWDTEIALREARDSMVIIQGKLESEVKKRHEAERLLNVYDAQEHCQVDEVIVSQSSEEEVMDIEFDLKIPWRHARDLTDSSLQFLNIQLEQQVTEFRKGQQEDLLSLEEKWEGDGYMRTMEIRDASRGKYHVHLKIRLKKGTFEIFDSKKISYEIPLRIDLVKLTSLTDGKPVLEVINILAHGKMTISEKGSKITYEKHGGLNDRF